MLVFTHRILGAGDSAEAFTRAFMPGSPRLAAAQVQADGPGWRLSQQDGDISEADALARLLPLFQGGKPLLLYVHGNNNTPANCFRRLSDLAALYPQCEVLGFSWAAEGFLSNGSPLPDMAREEEAAEAAAELELELQQVHTANRSQDSIRNRIRRYHQAQTNAKDSGEAFARLLRLLGAARLQANAQPFSLACHSLGAHLLQYTLVLPGATESVGTAHNVVLLAPCVRAGAHAEWLTRLRPRGRTYITYNPADSVLLGAYLADSEQTKLGTDPGPDIVRSAAVRYISFNNAPTDFGGHGYFVKRVSRPAKKLFARIFASQVDFAPNESPGAVYPMGCEADGSVCYMAAPAQPKDGS